ncbi:hypothetical protein [Streptomyces sp. DH37]|uniref:hypothetical protein n=1 Tax=Streptomyces sp. DH37 TaxID=3040122 RepID=UPI0024414C20|nr:hypothetical protein [Streptomyces sp. DH37]MDG9702909.1 hypothetical protein [Streptomyces sp. DH37]
MPRWIVLAVPVDGVAEADRDAQTVAEWESGPEEAAEALARMASTFQGRLRKVRRREVFRCSERSYFVRLQGCLATYGFLLQPAELVHDSAASPTARPFP